MNLLVLLKDLSNESNRVFNTAIGERTTILELFKMIRSSLGKFEIKINEIEPKLGNIREGDVPHSMASIEKAINILGYNPKVSVNEGIDKTVEWFYSFIHG